MTMPTERRQDIAAHIEAMTPERWQQINALFEAVLDQPPDARLAYLAEQAAGDPTLHDDVLALLESRAPTHDFLEASAGVYAAPLVPEAETMGLKGTRIGAYRVLERIGQGGMGTVYLAERDDVQTTVALKLVRGGLVSPEHVQRFFFERRLLARLNHPHIARLLDAGMTDDGAPFFAMEYIEGQAIDQYCDAHHLPVNERLALFLQACEAVRYAHQNLVVHRDLKPSNILVIPEASGAGSGGTVKLLDFGIAKLLENDADEPALTRTGMRLLTPEYAAPEQLRGEPVTTATDVYALGVLLYELLAGRRPFDDPAAGMGDLERALQKRDPRRPSTVAGTADQAVAEARATTPDKLRRRLRGDLDTICLKALRAEPAHRYPSAEHLLDDIHRHLEGLPVSARRDTASYRARKFIRRHRIGVAATAAIVLALLGGLVAATWQARIAEAERHKAEEVAAILPELFWDLEPGELQATAVTPEHMLDRGIARIETKLADQPEIQARILTLATDVYMRLAAHAKAEQAARRALALRQALFGEAHPEVAASMAMLAQALDKQARYDEAAPLHRQALAMRRHFLGTTHLDVATSLHNYALMLQDTGEYERAAQHYHEALAIRRAREAPPRDIAYTQTNLAVNHYYLGAYDEAEAHYREALALRRTALGPQHPDVANSLHNLAHLLRTQGNEEEAETMFREALTIHQAAYGNEHLFVSYSLTSLAGLLKDQGRFDEAEPLTREALRIRREALEATHPLVANSLYNLAAIHQARGATDEAETLYREALAMQRKRLGTDHPEVASTLYSLGSLLADAGTCETAEPLLHEALAIRQGLLPDDHQDIALTMSRLGACLITLHPDAEAASLLADSFVRLRDIRGLNDAFTQTALRRLVIFYEATGDTSRAVAHRALLKPSS